jgi:hypothetical protein
MTRITVPVGGRSAVAPRVLTRVPRRAALGRALLLGTALPALALAVAACGSGSAGAPAAQGSAGGATGGNKQPQLHGQVQAAYAASPPPLGGPASAWKTPVTLADQSSDVLRGADSWPGPKAAALNVYAMWDSKNLYLAATVFQDHPYSNSYSGGDVWKGDALWLYFSQSPGSNANVAKLTFVQAVNGPEVYDWLHNTLVSGVQMKLVPSGNQYWVAGAIPWSVLGVTPKAGAQLGFNAGTGFGSSGFIDLNGKDPDNDVADAAPLTLLPPGK